MSRLRLAAEYALSRVMEAMDVDVAIHLDTNALAYQRGRGVGGSCAALPVWHNGVLVNVLVQADASTCRWLELRAGRVGVRGWSIAPDNILADLLTMVSEQISALLEPDEIAVGDAADYDVWAAPAAGPDDDVLSVTCDGRELVCILHPELEDSFAREAA